MMNLSGQARQPKSIVTYDSLEALGAFQAHQATFWSHKVDTLLYLGVMVFHISPTVSFHQAMLLDY